MIYKATRSVLLLLILFCTVQYACSCDDDDHLTECNCTSLTPDSISSTHLQACKHTNITAHFNITIIPWNYQVLLVPQITYYNATLDKNVTITSYPGKFLSKDDQVLEFNPSLHSSVTKWTVVFCYDDQDDFSRYVLNPISCAINMDTSMTEVPLSSSVTWEWPPSSSVVLSPSSSVVLPPSSSVVLSPSSSVVLPPSSSVVLSPSSSVVLSEDVVSEHLQPTTITGQSSVASSQSSKVNHNTTEHWFPSTLSSVYNWTTNVTISTLTANTTLVSTTSESTPVTDTSSANSDVGTILTVTVFICATVILGSLSLSLCIIKLTKRSRVTSDDDSSYGRSSRMDKDIYSSSISLSSSIVTTLAPLAWDLDTPPTATYDHSTQDHTNIHCVQVIDTSSSANILYTTDDPYYSSMTSRHSNPSIMTNSTSGISEQSDTSNNMVNLPVEMDRISELSGTPRSVSSCDSATSSISLTSFELETRSNTNTTGTTDTIVGKATATGTTTGTTTGHQYSNTSRRYFNASPHSVTDELPNDSNAVYIVLTNSPTPVPSHVSSLYVGGEQREQQLPTYTPQNRNRISLEGNNECIFNGSGLLETTV